MSAKEYVYVFERRQRLKVRAWSLEIALREAERDDAPYDVGEVELIDRKDDDERGNAS